MELLSIFVVLSLVTRALAGGYAGSLERVWAFIAYEIDGLLPANEQTIGFRCRQWSVFNRICIDDDWIDCANFNHKAAGQRCNLAELTKMMDDVPDATDVNGIASTDPHTGRLNIQQSAVNYYNVAIKRPLYAEDSNGGATINPQNKPGGKVRDYGTWELAKADVVDYNALIDHVSGKVRSAAGSNLNGNQQLFDDFDAANSAITEAREGDHGPFLVEAAHRRLGGDGITIQEMDIGSGESPVNDQINRQTGARTPKRWRTLDLLATMRDFDPYDEIRYRRVYNFLDTFYSTGTPMSHKVVIQSYKQVTSDLRVCGVIQP